MISQSPRLVAVKLLIVSGLAIGSRSDAHIADPRPAAGSSARVETAGTGNVERATLGVPSFRFSYNSRLTIRGQQLIARLSGRIARSARWQLGGRAFYTYQVADPSVTLAAGASKKSEVTGVTEPFIVSAEGPAIEVAFAESASPGARQLLAGLAGVLQFQRPPSAAGSDSWSATERDVSGAYTARYSAQPNGWFEKTKIEYVGDLLPFEVEKSVAKGKLSDAGALVELSLVEELKSPALSLHYSTRLVFGSSQRNDPIVKEALGRFPSSYERLAIDTVGTQPGMSLDDMAPERRFPDAFAELIKAGRGAFDAPTMLAVKTRLQRNPNEIEQVVNELAKRPDQASTLTSVLVAIDRAEARRAVKHLLADEAQPRRVRIELLASLLLHGVVDEELVQILRRLTSSQDAELALAAINVEGELLRRASERSSFDTTAAREAYLERAGACGPVKQCAAYITGLGYIDTPRAREIVLQKLESSRVELRLAAIRALESIKDPSLDASIVSALQTDLDFRVRDRAIKACSYRGSARCAEALRTELTRAKSSEQRITLVEALGSGRFPRAEVRPVIARVAGADPDRTVSTFARKLLNQFDQANAPKRTASRVPD